MPFGFSCNPRKGCGTLISKGVCSSPSPTDHHQIPTRNVSFISISPCRRPQADPLFYPSKWKYNVNTHYDDLSLWPLHPPLDSSIPVLVIRPMVLFKKTADPGPDVEWLIYYFTTRTRLPSAPHLWTLFEPRSSVRRSVSSRRLD